MKNNKYRVSRATLYNTIELLLDCNLVTKHQFGNNCAQFERSFKFRQHDHFVSIDDATVLEFCDPRLMEIQKSVEELLNVEITHHSLIFMGASRKKKLLSNRTLLDPPCLNSRAYQSPFRYWACIS